ncbi:MAG TPA: EamA family transporter [Longimicrobium sp.]|jgi:drug/metabolite transporter (DMT)-like permease
MAYLLALASSLFYGAADFLGGLAARRTATLPVVVVSQLAGLLLLLAVMPLLAPAAPAGTDLAWGAAGGVAGGVGVGLLYHALSISAMSVVAPVTAVCAIAVPVVAGLALGERPGAGALAGVGLAAVAIGLISREPAPDRPVLLGATGRGVLLALAAGLAIGAFYVALERTAPAAGLWPLVAARATSVAMLAAVALAARRRLRPDRGALRIILAGGALDMLANLLYLLAVRQGLLSVVAPLASLYPAATVLLAWIVLGERLHWFQGLGLAFAALAIALITGG